MKSEGPEADVVMQLSCSEWVTRLAEQPVVVRLFYHRQGRGRNGLERLGSGFRGLMIRGLHHVEVFLRDQMAFHPQPEFVAAWCRENQ